MNLKRLIEILFCIFSRFKMFSFNLLFFINKKCYLLSFTLIKKKILGFLKLILSILFNIIIIIFIYAIIMVCIIFNYDSDSELSAGTDLLFYLNTKLIDAFFPFSQVYLNDNLTNSFFDLGETLDNKKCINTNYIRSIIDNYSLYNKSDFLYLKKYINVDAYNNLYFKSGDLFINNYFDSYLIHNNVIKKNFDIASKFQNNDFYIYNIFFFGLFISNNLNLPGVKDKNIINICSNLYNLRKNLLRNIFFDYLNIKQELRDMENLKLQIIRLNTNTINYKSDEADRFLLLYENLYNFKLVFFNSYEKFISNLVSYDNRFDSSGFLYLLEEKKKTNYFEIDEIFNNDFFIFTLYNEDLDFLIENYYIKSSVDKNFYHFYDKLFDLTIKSEIKRILKYDKEILPDFKFKLNMIYNEARNKFEINKMPFEIQT